MKIAFCLSLWGLGNRILDFDNLYNSNRGLSGTDLTLVTLAKEMAKLNHEIHLFTIYTSKSEIWENVKLHHFDQRHTIVQDDWVVISINEPDSLRGLPNKCLKICFQLLNDFSYCQPNFDEEVNIWLTCSNMLMERLKLFTPNSDKWNILPLGCDPSLYKKMERIPGRVVWASSPDRGAHNLLEIWPKIKKEVPYASLRIFYNFNFDSIMDIEPSSQNGLHQHVKESAQRCRYIVEAVKRLKPFDVEHIGSVSCRQIELELSRSEILGYSCDVISFTEGYSLSTLQSCAAGVLPILCGVDCLTEIYGDVIPMVNSPIRKHLNEYTDLIIRGLKDENWKNEVTGKCKEFSKKYLWNDIAKKLEIIITKKKNHE